MGLIPWKHDGDHSAKRTLKASFDGRARSQERPWKEQKEGSGRVVEKNQWGLCPGGRGRAAPATLLVWDSRSQPLSCQMSFLDVAAGDDPVRDADRRGGGEFVVI